MDNATQRASHSLHGHKLLGTLFFRCFDSVKQCKTAISLIELLLLLLTIIVQQLEYIDEPSPFLYLHYNHHPFHLLS